MTTTPWDEARRELVEVADVAIGYTITVPPLHLQDREDDDPERLEWSMENLRQAAENAIDSALTALSRHGWRLVPAEATEEMVKAYRDRDYSAPLEASLNDVTEAGDVLRPGRAEGGGSSE